ncbi:hypothetical protein A3F66_02575 [candidate division TM6 bacterium RIFCSPHIGHO2_12_FULL_32_22]|nr:MAG: hypothetical protein A3F66_02575 [candidate division TM6 bacterium RIFCSPHIGHO2_12_FULL_32_22]
MKRMLFLGLFITYAASAADLSVPSRKRTLDMGSLSQDGAVPKAPALIMLAAAVDTLECPEDSGSETEEFEDELMIIDDESDTAGPADDQPVMVAAQRVETVSRPEIGESEVKNARQYRERLENGRSRCIYRDCNKEFSKTNNALTHIRSVHLKQYRFFCDAIKCNFAANSISNLHKHQQRRHGAEKEFKCSFKDCDESFIAKYDLDIHIRKHRGEGFSCNKCDFKTYKRSTFLSHMDRTHGESKFNCDFPGCESSFVKKADLTRHKKLHVPKDERKLICPIENCEYRSNFAHDIERHLRNFHKKDPAAAKELVKSLK